MTIEEKAKAYDEAIEKIKYVMEHGASPVLNKEDLQGIFPELKESEDEKVRKSIIAIINNYVDNSNTFKPKMLAWLEKQGEQNQTLPKWKYKKDHTPLLRDSLILNKYGCVAKSPSGAIISDVWVIDYDELAKLPKEEFEKQGEQKPTQETEPFEAEHGKYYYCIKDYFCGGRKQASKGDVIQALRGLPIMGLKDASEYFLPVNSIKCDSAWKPSDEQIDAIRLARSLVKDDFSEYPTFSKILIELEK